MSDIEELNEQLFISLEKKLADPNISFKERVELIGKLPREYSKSIKFIRNLAMHDENADIRFFAIQKANPNDNELFMHVLENDEEPTMRMYASGKVSLITPKSIEFLKNSYDKENDEDVKFIIYQRVMELTKKLCLPIMESASKDPDLKENLENDMKDCEISPEVLKILKPSQEQVSSNRKAKDNSGMNPVF